MGLGRTVFGDLVVERMQDLLGQPVQVVVVDTRGGVGVQTTVTVMVGVVVVPSRRPHGSARLLRPMWVRGT